MPRPLRVEYEGARYHVMCRGNRGQSVFETDDDVGLFLKTLGEAVERTELIVHSYVLMKTHYHLLIETPCGNLVEAMKWLQGAFTQRMNAMHHTWGHLFQGRYKAKVIEQAEPEYFRRVSNYIHLNPAAAGLAGHPQGNPLEAYTWSSYPYYIKAPSKRPPWLQVAELLGHHGLSDSISGRKRYRQLMGALAEDAASDLKGYADSPENRGMERGWVHGSKAFRQEIAEQMAQGDLSDYHGVYDASQKRDLSEQAAEQDIEKAFRLFGINSTTLPERPKNDEIKVIVAAYIKRYYPLQNKQISEMLSMGHPTSISRCRAMVEENKVMKKQYEKLCRCLNK